MAKRKGFTIIEMAAALFVLAVLMALTARMLGAQGRQRRMLEYRRIALIEVGNLAESVRARDWEALSPMLGESLALSPAAQELPEARLEVEVHELPEPKAKRVTLRLRWRDAAGQLVPPVRLTTWVYRESERPKR